LSFSPACGGQGEAEQERQRDDQGNGDQELRQVEPEARDIGHAQQADDQHPGHQPAQTRPW
jgi:hypothetical protein